MGSVTPNQVALRANVSVEANRNVEIVKAELRVEGKKMTKEEVVDYMLKGFKMKKK
jgi:hypothetical protein